MESNDLERVARHRVKRKRDLVMHLVLYLAVNAMLVAIWAITGRGYPWFLWPLVGWGMAVVADLISAMMELYLPEEQAVERELHRLRRRTT